MSQTRKPTALFPDLPRSPVMVDVKNGNATPSWELYNQQLNLALQNNLKSEGFVLPPLTDTQIAAIQALYTPFIGQSYQLMLQSLPDISGQSIFDSVNRVPKVFIITYNGSQIITAASWKTYVLI